MRTKQLGTTDLAFTVLGLGTWAMGGPWEVGSGPQDDLYTLEPEQIEHVEEMLEHRPTIIGHA